MRLFFALWPDDDIRLQLASQRLEIARLTGGRPTLPVTLHMTLVFMDNVPEERLAELQMLAIRVQTPAFDYRLDTAGCFGGPAVAWIASDATPRALFKLQSALQRAVAEAGFEVDQRTFRPHITVARQVTHNFESYPITPVVWPIRHFCLVKPIKSAAGIYYEIVDQWPLIPLVS